MLTWLRYRTADWSRGSSNGLQDVHVAVVRHCRFVTWLWYGNAVWSRGCGTGMPNADVAVVWEGRMVTWPR